MGTQGAGGEPATADSSDGEQDLRDQAGPRVAGGPLVVFRQAAALVSARAMVSRTAAEAELMGGNPKMVTMGPGRSWRPTRRRSAVVTGPGQIKSKSKRKRKIRTGFRLAGGGGL